MRFSTKLFFVSFFCGLVLALSVLPLPAEELKLQLQFQDDRSIITPDGKYHTVVEDIDIGLEDGNVCMVYNVDLDGPAVLDQNGWGKITVIFRETNRQKLMDIGEFFDFAMSICEQQQNEGDPTGRPFLFLCYASLTMKRSVVLEKEVGETPLECAEKWRAAQSDAYRSVPLAYAGRLDPMASGKLLVLIGEECKQQERYHHLDKEYHFSVLLGVATDTADVLGLITVLPRTVLGRHAHGLITQSKGLNPLLLDKLKVTTACKKLTGSVELPYPHFSSKTVQGKPLHTWAVEGRLNEIEIPTKRSTIYRLKLIGTKTKTGADIFDEVSKKIESIPPVTDPRKAPGNDFRRPEIRTSWAKFFEQYHKDTFTILHFTCVASSGTYMRTLAEVIARELDTVGLAYSIHRTKIGTYHKLPAGLHYWYPRYF